VSEIPESLQGIKVDPEATPAKQEIIRSASLTTSTKRIGSIQWFG
jgi:hypothetical protein